MADTKNITAFNADNFAKFIIDNNVIGFHKDAITLKSGHKSNWYVNWRTCTADVFLMDQVTDFVMQFIKQNDLNPDAIIGVPEGATKLGVLSQYKWAMQQTNYQANSHCLPMLRKVPKKHGASADRYCVGSPRGKVILLEDVTTSGGSLLETLEQLQKLDVEVIAAISLANRMAKRDDGLSVSEAVAKFGVKFYSMANAVNILPQTYIAQQPGVEIGKQIEQELAKYNCQQVKIVEN